LIDRATVINGDAIEIPGSAFSFGHRRTKADQFRRLGQILRIPETSARQAR
jgi:hypothetical protein